MAISGIISGSYLIYKGNTKNYYTHYVLTPFGVLVMSGGVIYGGISIPFWVSSKKRKKERDRLIEMYDKQPLE